MSGQEHEIASFNPHVKRGQNAGVLRACGGACGADLAGGSGSADAAHRGGICRRARSQALGGIAARKRGAPEPGRHFRGSRPVDFRNIHRTYLGHRKNPGIIWICPGSGAELRGFHPDRRSRGSRTDSPERGTGHTDAERIFGRNTASSARTALSGGWPPAAVRISIRQGSRNA